MPPRGAHAATPYMVVVVFKPWGGKASESVQCRRKHLSDAIAYARRAELAWIRLIGAQYSPLRWEVVDCRDYRRYNPFMTTIPGGSHGKSNARQRRPHA